MTLKSWKNPNILGTFQAMIGRKFALLTIMNNEDTDLDSMITTFNAAVTKTASEILGKHRQKTKTLGHCRYSWSVRQKERTKKETIWTWRIWEIQGSEQQHQEVHEKAKENLIGEQCGEIEEILRRNNSKRAYQLEKDSTTMKKGKATTLQDY